MHTSTSTSVYPPTETNNRPTDIKPVWLRVPDAIRLTGLCRSSIYGLITSGKVKSFTNKIHRDCQRGTRLISYDSLVAYMERAYQDAVANGQNN
ncbi:MAG: helix-turn-helix domain-containing protein [Verrucomicrobiota bacterium]